MKKKGKRLLRRLTGMLMGVAAFGLLQVNAIAGSTESLQLVNAGGAEILDADLVVECVKSSTAVETAVASHSAESAEKNSSKKAENRFRDVRGGLRCSDILV